MRASALTLLTILALAGCSSSSDGKKALSVPADLDGSLTAAAKASSGTGEGLAFLKAHSAISRAVSPSSGLLDETPSQNDREDERQLNQRGRYWLQLMRAHCQVSHPGQVDADRSSMVQHSVNSKVIGGSDCPISLNETTTNDVSIDKDSRTATAITHNVSRETRIDSQFINESRGISMATDLTTSITMLGIQTADQQLHATSSGTMEMELTGGLVTGTAQVEMIVRGQDKKSAFVVNMTTPRGAVTVSILRFGQNVEYRLNGVRVTKAEFKDVFGSAPSVTN